jgi:hypothetical protein
MDRAPSYDSSSTETYSPPIEDRSAPAHTADFAAPTTSGAEPSRRRSTIREPAPFAGEGAPPPPSSPSPSTPATPVISSTTSEETPAPRRGWWGKRLLSDKG